MDAVVVSAASFLVIRLLGQEQERRRKKLPQKTQMVDDHSFQKSGNLQWKWSLGGLGSGKFTFQDILPYVPIRFWSTDNKRSRTNQWLVRRVLLVSWLVISSTILASIASHASTSSSNVDGSLREFKHTRSLPRAIPRAVPLSKRKPWLYPSSRVSGRGRLTIGISRMNECSGLLFSTFILSFFRLFLFLCN
jgi:hypothetical protein